MSPSRRGKALALALGLTAALGVAGPVAPQAPLGLFAVDGYAWRALAEPEKLALLQGFLAGAGFEAGMALSPTEDGPSPEALEAMRRQGRLRFPYAPNVYKARLEDFYYYQDRRSMPLYRALLLITDQIRKGATPGP